LRGDFRGRRVAVVPDSVVNPPHGVPDLLPRLAADGWGIIALASAELGSSERAALLDLVVEQVVTFLDDNYDVALVDGEDRAIQAFATKMQEIGRAVPRVLELEAG
jgi:hypothetical protein